MYSPVTSDTSDIPKGRPLGKASAAERRRNARQQETADQRAERLQRDAEAKRLKLDSETAEQRAARLLRNAETYRSRIDNETAEQPAARLQRNAETYRSRTDNETAEQPAARLLPEQPAARLLRNAETYRSRIDNETAEQRAARPLRNAEIIEVVLTIKQQNNVLQDFCVMLKLIEVVLTMKQQNNMLQDFNVMMKLTGDFGDRLILDLAIAHWHLHPWGQTLLHLHDMDHTASIFTVKFIIELEHFTQTVLANINKFAMSYKILRDVEKEAIQEANNNGTELPNIVIAIKNDRTQDVRRYNKPTASEVAVVFQNDDGEPPFIRDILIHLKPIKNQPMLKRISILGPNLDALVYPLFYPRAEQGWATYLKQKPGSSQMQYYSYSLSVRDKFNPLLNGGKLTQQFIVDAYVKMETNRLQHIKDNQSKLRTEKYSGLMDHKNARAENENLNVGKAIILPSSFEISARNMQQRYQDAKLIVIKYEKPDLFVTMTCNPKWKEITGNLEPWQKAEHRPDLVARAFNLKLKELLKEIKSGLFGKLTAMVHVIEFQKRGLPHAHILIKLAAEAKFNT
ncbi:hypothetical protein LAZ67_13000809 [Cordylochernes scorpioides]|uniref:Helitron helicase-like domain-containing protein n=1 Tax=Cordylochernes scorpioides TaxID=51811 RepID=A0ABY6L7A0_9ARAC|nr:hypothetical protein LAZ67_13000809 [Cordylochernes scorpioides]